MKSQEENLPNYETFKDLITTTFIKCWHLLAYATYYFLTVVYILQVRRVECLFFYTTVDLILWVLRLYIHTSLKVWVNPTLIFWLYPL